MILPSYLSLIIPSLQIHINICNLYANPSDDLSNKKTALK